MVIAIIGAGLAGAACARRLQAAGKDVALFDKGRGPGGRLSTRRAVTPVGTLGFDHGGQFFTARHPDFQAHVAAWRDAGLVEPWAAKILGPRDSNEPLYVGVGGMNGLVRATLEGANARFSARVTAIEGGVGAWSLVIDSANGREQVGPFGAVVCAVPAEQQGALLEAHAPALAAEARRVRSAPCWALLTVLERADGEGATWPDALRVPSGALSWVARQGSRPGFPEEPVAYVAHATAAWSRENLELSAETVADQLTVGLAERLAAHGASSFPIWSQAHRWRYALVEEAVGEAFGWDPGARIGAIGDWRLGGRIEAAWLSGDALGRALVAGL